MTADLRARIYAKTAELSGLTVDKIGPETTLEAIGLESPDAVILAMEVEELTGQEVDVGVFLRYLTLGETVDEILRLQGAGATS